MGEQNEMYFFNGYNRGVGVLFLVGARDFHFSETSNRLWGPPSLGV
jgi:hypothetical protein